MFLLYLALYIVIGLNISLLYDGTKRWVASKNSIIILWPLFIIVTFVKKFPVIIEAIRKSFEEFVDYVGRE